MKKLLLMLSTVALALAAAAQTNSTLSTNVPDTAASALAHADDKGTNSHARAEIEILSDSGEVNLDTRIAIHTGHVRVNDPQLKLTCERLTARLPTNSVIDYILAETNVVIDAVDEKGRPVHATSDLALYTYKVDGSVTNRTVELRGNAHLRSEDGDATGDPIIWDLVSHTVKTTKPRVVYAIPQRTDGTNAPATGATEPKP